jgi:addiction module HigA family antidote
MLPPIHPGEILLEEFLKPLEMNPHQLAMALRLPPNRIAQIIAGERALTADTALRASAAILASIRSSG